MHVLAPADASPSYVGMRACLLLVLLAMSFSALSVALPKPVLLELADGAACTPQPLLLLLLLLTDGGAAP